VKAQAKERDGSRVYHLQDSSRRRRSSATSSRKRLTSASSTEIRSTARLGDGLLYSATECLREAWFFHAGRGG